MKLTKTSARANYQANQKIRLRLDSKTTVPAEIVSISETRMRHPYLIRYHDDALQPRMGWYQESAIQVERVA